ncbi:MAG: diguanylate cyclase [Gammaproteobacteria bacterium]|nr:diguanylate cyclase [Gammaproteobacteria bacterium]MCP5423558.1 diguanylate cyclase [Gammaproteobacteria bacterium]
MISASVPRRANAGRRIEDDSVSDFEPADEQTFMLDLERFLADRPERRENALLWMEVEGLQEAAQKDEIVSESLAQQVIKLLSVRLEQGGPLARLGTQCFAVLIRSRPAVEALQMARVLRTVMQNTGFYRRGDVVYLGIHIGLILFSRHCEKAELLDAAAAACRFAKQEGFNRIHVLQLG